MATGQRANAFEILGAWLGIWTPPRDVEVPPFPRRAGAAVAAGLLVVVALVVVLVAPAIDGSKSRRAAADATRARAERAADRARVVREQRARRGSATALLPVSGAPAAVRVRARERLLARAQVAIRTDAQARVRAGELTGRVGAVRCERMPGAPALEDLAAARGAFDCFVATATIRSTAESPSGEIGYPFRAVVDWRTFRFSWCKVHQIPGERSLPGPGDTVLLPPACRL